jgi:hypothetical protein
MKYKSLYSFEVAENIYVGKQVFMVDKETCIVHSVNHMTVDEFMRLYKDEDTSMRYAFWYKDGGDEDVANGS